MTYSIALVCEAEADRRTATKLAERLILESVDWIDESNLGHFIAWRGYRATEPFLKWKDLKALARELDIVPRFEKGVIRHPYSHLSQKAIRVLAQSPDPVDAIVLFADTDDDPDRKLGLEQSRNAYGKHLAIVVGMPHTEREAWHIAGFEPADDGERATLTEVRQLLGLDPCTNSHVLSPKKSSDPKGTKSVLDALTATDELRNQMCLECPIPLLQQRGKQNGLVGYFDEMRQYLINPLILGGK